MENPKLKQFAKWKKNWTPFLVTLVAGLGQIGLGTMFGFPAPAISLINSNPKSFHLSQTEAALVASSSSLGGMLGAPLGWIFTDRIGRKSTLICAVAPFAVGWMLISGSPSFNLLLTGRLLTGFFGGALNVGIPLFVSETTPANLRAIMAAYCEFFYNCGLLYVYLFGAFVSWKWLAVTCQMIPTLLVLLLLFVPESPYWLMKMGMKDNCQESLKWLRGHDVDVTLELKELEDNVKTIQTFSSKWTEFLDPKIYRPLLVIVGLFLFQQLAGNAVMYQYTVMILQDAKVSSSDSYYQTAIFGAVGVIANFVSAIVVNRVGRRIMLLLSGALLTLSLSGLAVYFSLLEFSSNADFGAEYSKVVFACILMYNVSVSMGYGPIPLCLASEMLPLKVRGMATGLCLPSVSLFAFVTSLAFPYAVHGIGYYGVFWFMAGCGFLSIIFAFFLVSETKRVVL